MTDSAERAAQRNPRTCEVCGHNWKTREGYIWIVVLCPKCRISGYHQPSAQPKGEGEMSEARERMTAEEFHKQVWRKQRMHISDGQRDFYMEMEAYAKKERERADAAERECIKWANSFTKQLADAATELKKVADQKVESLRTELREAKQVLANIKELGRVTMATETGREIILAAIDEALLSRKGEGS